LRPTIAEDVLQREIIILRKTRRRDVKHLFVCYAFALSDHGIRVGRLGSEFCMAKYKAGRKKNVTGVAVGV
jgi:hypothetical protein